MYSSNRVVTSNRSPEKRRIRVPRLPNVVDPPICFDLRSAGTNSDVMVYDATNHKLLRRESPSGEIIERY